MSDHYVYVLRCADDTLYTGYTTDVARRVREHDDGEGARYTRGRTPVELVYTERFPSRSAAMSREHELKELSKAEKERLIADPPEDLPGEEADDEADADGKRGRTPER